MNFKYHTGEIIQVGDHVNFAGAPTIVEMIFLPNTAAAADYACSETGGIMILVEPNTARESRFLQPAWDDYLNEDLDFVAHRSDTKPS